ncbi:hypothetical protein HBB16_10225 [Pseudonocardia sp. MCCB 268]|nr:hypothetical protein [Pseudonocardia cytotoxica]
MRAAARVSGPARLPTDPTLGCSGSATAASRCTSAEEFRGLRVDLPPCPGRSRSAARTDDDRGPRRGRTVRRRAPAGFGPAAGSPSRSDPRTVGRRSRSRHRELAGHRQVRCSRARDAVTRFLLAEAVPYGLIADDSPGCAGTWPTWSRPPRQRPSPRSPAAAGGTAALDHRALEFIDAHAHRDVDLAAVAGVRSGRARCRRRSGNGSGPPC